MMLGDEESRIDIVSQNIVHDGFRRYGILTFSDRSWGPAETSAPVERELLMTHRTAAVLPVDRSSGDLVLLRQFRIGAHQATGRGVMIEIAAGAVDDGETVETAAVRELKEETGLEPIRIEWAADFLPTPGMCDEYATLFIALVDADNLPEKTGTDADETIFPFRAKLGEVLDAADAGRITNGFTLLALNWYARHRARFEREET